MFRASSSRRIAVLSRSPPANVKFVVQPRETLPEHTVSRQQFETWLAKEGVASPAETFQRNTIRDLLKGTETPARADDTFLGP